MSYFTIFYPLQVHLNLLNSIKVKKNMHVLFKVEISITHNISSSELLNRLLHKKHVQV
jgi:hypothetical protein